MAARFETRRLCASARGPILIPAASCITIPKLSGTNSQLLRGGNVGLLSSRMRPSAASAGNFRLGLERWGFGGIMARSLKN